MTPSILVTAGAFAALAAAQLVVTSPSVAENGAPRYEVDAAWPKPLPDRWVLGGLGGVCVDAQDHVVILNRQDILRQGQQFLGGRGAVGYGSEVHP
jgi:hypothetical protein